MKQGFFGMTPLFKIRPEGTIGVCAPSARFDREKFHKGCQVLEGMGFKVRVPKDIFGKKRYLAGGDRSRAGVVNRLFSDPGIDGIICARGGFGAMRILQYLDWDLIGKHPKPIVGFSDASALLLAIMERTGQPVIHGPTLLSLSDTAQKTIDSLWRSLTGRRDNILFSSGTCLRPGKSSGVLKGGNLATLSHLAGTRFQPDFSGAVLFIEDIGEPAYKIDRMLSQMKMAGMFDGVNGVITGTFKDCKNDDYIPQILLEVFDRYIPVANGLNSGHDRINLSLVMGAAVELDADNLSLRWLASDE